MTRAAKIISFHQFFLPLLCCKMFQDIQDLRQVFVSKLVRLAGFCGSVIGNTVKQNVLTDEV